MRLAGSKYPSVSSTVKAEVSMKRRSMKWLVTAMKPLVRVAKKWWVECSRMWRTMKGRYPSIRSSWWGSVCRNTDPEMSPVPAAILLLKLSATRRHISFWEPTFFLRSAAAQGLLLKSVSVRDSILFCLSTARSITVRSISCGDTLSAATR